MLIGLTGGIASGKTTVGNFLQQLGAVRIDSDKIAHQVLRKNGAAYQRVVEKFGDRILDEDGEIIRSRLGEIIFSNEQRRRELENITHPAIISEIFKKIEEYREKDRIIILDAPLLFETGLDRIVDQTWVVYLDRKTQLNRLLIRDKLSPRGAEERIDAQMSLEKKRELADTVIYNTGNLDELKKNVLKKWRDLVEN